MDATVLASVITPLLAFASGAMALVVNEGRSNRKAIQELSDAIWTYIDAVSEERGEFERMYPTRYSKGKRRV